MQINGIAGVGVVLTVVLVGYSFAVPPPVHDAAVVAPVVWSYEGERIVNQVRVETPPRWLADIRATLFASWSGKTDPVASDATARLESAALGIAQAVELEEPLYTATPPRLRTAYWLIALAQSETDWSWMVKTGACNKFEWRQKFGNFCDSGAAFGYWSMHLDEQHRPGDPTGAQVLLDDTLAAATAIRWLRDTPTAWGSWAAQKARADALFAKRHPEFRDER